MPSPSTFVSTIMVSYYTGEPLTDAVEAVLTCSQIDELILVNNGNPAEVCNFFQTLAKSEPRFRFIDGHGNIGFAAASNLGAQYARGQYFWFLNPDTHIEEDTLTHLLKAAQSTRSPWLAGGKLVTANGEEQRGSRRNRLTPISAIVSFTPLHRLPGLKSLHLEKEPYPQQPVDMPVISGSCMLTDRESFTTINGFDEAYFLHVEDIDLCRRVWEMNGQVLFVPKAETLHFGSTSRVPIVFVEWEKAKGFVRYFYKFSNSFPGKIATCLAAPFIVGALLIRALFLSLRHNRPSGAWPQKTMGGTRA